MKVWRCRWCGRRVSGVWGWFHQPDQREINKLKRELEKARRTFPGYAAEERGEDDE